MNLSETAFLVLGLVLGTAVGAALWQAVRGWSAPRREVRLTVTPNSIPAGRRSTLAIPGGVWAAGPLPGSPDGDAATYDAVPTGTGSPVRASRMTASDSQVRTPVPSTRAGIPAGAVGVPIVVEEPAVMPIQPITAVSVVHRAGLAAVAAGRSNHAKSASYAVGTRAPAVSTSLARSAGAVAVLDAPPSRADSGANLADGGGLQSTAIGSTEPSRATAEPAGAGATPGEGPTSTPRVAGPAGGDGTPGIGGAADADGNPGAMAGCSGERRLVEERCALADAARDEARRTADALRAAQRAYDELRERVERAQDAADPRRVAEAKARLHATFRAANELATTPDEAESAARAWLDAINRLNAAVRDAARLGEAGSAELKSQLPLLDRLGLEAEAARIASENAADGCTAARVRLAECEEAALVAAAAAAVPEEPEDEHPFARVWPNEEPAFDPSPPPEEVVGGVSSIIRVLRGDREARERIVAAVAGPEPDAQREWHLRLAGLVDAITARAIEDGYLDLPQDSAFWGLFDTREARDIVGALSALGFRYDGLGGFADGRVPTMRDLSLAVGYAGLDRMRIRQWPREDAMGGLFAGALVASDEWLVDQAGDLSLGRMVDALGSRAASLADTWNAWGRVRPVLLGA